MIETTDIKNYAKTMFTRGDSGKDQDLMNPDREWFFLSMLFVVLFIGGALFSVQQYQMYAALSDSVEVTRDLTITQYQESRVLDVHKYFTERSIAYNLLLQETSQLPATTTPETVGDLDEEDLNENDELQTDEVDGEPEVDTL